MAPFPVKDVEERLEADEKKRQKKRMRKQYYTNSGFAIYAKDAERAAKRSKTEPKTEQTTQESFMKRFARVK